MNEMVLTFLLAGCCVALGAGIVLWLGRLPHGVRVIRNDLSAMEERTKVKLSELNAALTAVNEELVKVKTEVETLANSLKDVDLPADAQASLDKLQALAKSIDDINPDAV